MTGPADLEARLTDLASALDAPDGDAVAPAVLARLRTSGVDVALPAVPRRRRRWRVLVAVGALIAGGAVAAPAVADWLGVRGVEVRQNEPVTPTSGTVPRSGASLDLGTPVPSLAAAAQRAGFAPVVPTALGPPDAIWVDRRGAAPFISLVYDGGPLVTEFDATLSEDAVVSKMAGRDTVVERLRIGGEPAMWIDGIHTVAVRARGGTPVFERLRLSDHVLLVQHGALTVRIEVPPVLGRDDAVRIAESLPR